ncbi:MAG TPA: hypothetical protein VF403_09970 [Kofleriaceae bacterium]
MIMIVIVIVIVIVIMIMIVIVTAHAVMAIPAFATRAVATLVDHARSHREQVSHDREAGDDFHTLYIYTPSGRAKRLVVSSHYETRGVTRTLAERV